MKMHSDNHEINFILDVAFYQSIIDAQADHL